MLVLLTEPWPTIRSTVLAHNVVKYRVMYTFFVTDEIFYKLLFTVTTRYDLLLAL